MQSMRVRDMPLLGDPADCCWKCVSEKPPGYYGDYGFQRMMLCTICGNKRCPHANDHRNTCTNSNEVGQKGSAYP